MKTLIFQIIAVIIVSAIFGGCGHDYAVRVESDTEWHGWFGKTLTASEMYERHGTGTVEIDVNVDRTVSDRGAIVQLTGDPGFVRLVLIKRSTGISAIFDPGDHIIDTAETRDSGGIATVTGR